MFLLLLIPIVQACDFVELPDISENPHQIYVVRNHSSNREWNKGFTLQNMNKTLHSKVIQHALPQTRPTDFKSMLFAEFLEKHIWSGRTHLFGKNWSKFQLYLMLGTEYAMHKTSLHVSMSVGVGAPCE